MTAAERIPTLNIPIPARENTRARALRFLLEGRLTVRAVHNGRAYIDVRGDSGITRAVVLKGGLWRCSCPARPGSCAHVLAAMSIINIQPEGDPAP